MSTWLTIFLYVYCLCVSVCLPICLFAEGEQKYSPGGRTDKGLKETAAMFKLTCLSWDPAGHFNLTPARYCLKISWLFYWIDRVRSWQDRERELLRGRGRERDRKGVRGREIIIWALGREARESRTGWISPRVRFQTRKIERERKKVVEK